jgi:alpha/beta superfamily hydrolase
VRDNAWPHESVRSVIEQLASDEVERGVVIERFNMRGVYGKAIGEGGVQERVLARQSLDWAEAMPGYPRTAALLMHISESWLREAEQADLSAAKESLRW